MIDSGIFPGFKAAIRGKVEVMNKVQFKNQYSYYRKAARAAVQDTAREWAETFNPLPLSRGSDILTARAAGFRFAHPKNRAGQYGWESMGFHL